MYDSIDFIGCYSNSDSLGCDIYHLTAQLKWSRGKVDISFSKLLK